MKKASNRKSREAGRAEYDFSQAIRGKYATRYAQGTNVVVLDPDVARAFPRSIDVNEALRALAGIIERRRPKVPAH